MPKLWSSEPLKVKAGECKALASEAGLAPAAIEALPTDFGEKRTTVFPQTE